jgi:putative DNA methylase
VPKRSDLAAGPRRRPLLRCPLTTTLTWRFANEIARLESYNKHHYRPNTYMHKWWARRCGSTFRLILKHLVTDPARQDYYVAGGFEGKVVLDPMMGGGTTLHEALRLGADVVGVDIDAIPCAAGAGNPLAGLPTGLGGGVSPPWWGRLTKSWVHYLTLTAQRAPALVPLRFTLYGAQRSCACGPALLVDSTTLSHERAA